MKRRPNITLPHVSYRRGTLLTENLDPPHSVYGEDLIDERGTQYRSWDPRRSKLAAGLLNGLRIEQEFEEPVILYLGAASGTSVSHLSDIYPKGIIYAVEFAPMPFRDLYLLAKRRKNILPIFANANDAPYIRFVPHADIVFMDIAQRNQVEILRRNAIFADRTSLLMLCVKSRSIDVTAQPTTVFAHVRGELHKDFKVLQEIRLEPYERDHTIFLLKRR